VSAILSGISLISSHIDAVKEFIKSSM
jgi:hypothetical protein